VRRGIAISLLVVALGAGLVACKPQPSPPDPPQGFDTCAAPSAWNMQDWWNNSPFTSVGIYVGGANRGCAQPNLTSEWVSAIIGQGWKLLPIWVGPQAPCTTLGSTTRLNAAPLGALGDGYNEGLAAADRMAALGFGWLAPVYYDLEGYPRSTACSAAIRSFSDGWVYALNSRGYLAGLYSSLCSGIIDMGDGVPTAKYVLNAVWIAAWNDTPNVYGFNSPGCSLWDLWWSNHQRVHQFKGGHDELWGNALINIDSNAVDGPTYPN
jgi:hypothetical protein